MEQNFKTNQKLNIALNKADVFMLAFGAMIGWGWVVLSGHWISQAGTLGAILAFVGGGCVVLFVGAVYAELAAAMPSNQGVYLFSQRAFGKNAAFICTWSVLLGFISVIAFEAVTLPSVVTYLFPDYLSGYLYSVMGFDIYATWLAVGIGGSILIATINYFGVKTAAVLQTILTVFIVLVGLVFLGGSTANGSAQNMQPLFRNGWGGILTVAVMTPFTYVGFDVIPQVAEEMKLPAKKIGQTIMLSIILAILWYVLIILCVGRTIQAEQIEGSLLPTADAMSNAFHGNSTVSKLMVVGGICGCIASWNGFYIGASRSICILAREGMLPACMGKLHPKHKTPTNAIALIAVVTTLAPLLGKNMLTWAANAGGFATVITYLMISLAFLILRKKEPLMARPYAIRHYRIVGVGAVLLCVGMLALYLPVSPSALSWPYEWAIVGGWTLLGIALFCLAKRRRFR